MINKNIISLTILLFVCNLLNAQQSQRLIKNWEFVKNDLGSPWEAVRPSDRGGSSSVPIWTKVSLPHCVNAMDAVDPDVNYYAGPSWYRTKLSINNPYAAGRTLLHFEGAGQKTEVYVYLTKVGTHVGGYDEFTFDITSAVEDFKKDAALMKRFGGMVPVSVRTDNSRDVEIMPSNLSDFNVYGGLYRYVNLVYAPKLHVEKLFAAAQVDQAGKKGTVNVRARFNKEAAGTNSAEVKLNLIDPSGKTLQSKTVQLQNFTGDVNISTFDINKPILWSPDQPMLYTAELTATLDDGTIATHKEKIGFKNFEFVKKGPFMLNGKRLLLRGTHRHEDHAGVGAAMTEDLMRKEMIMMKEMGVNFIRLGHYQQSRIILNLCDSLGILVWEEIPWCRGGLGGESYQAMGKRMLTNMIEQHYNHPSVIIWGLGNENDWPGDFPEFDTLKIRNYMKELNDLSHKLDPSRKTAIRRCDFCKDIVDVYSPSIWAGWYRGRYEEYKEISRRGFESVDRFLHVEWGADNHALRHSEDPEAYLKEVKATGEGDERSGDAVRRGGNARASSDGDWSESYFVNLADWTLKEQETMPWLTGAAQWPFKDFSTPARPENPIRYMNQKGVTERDLTKKETYYVFQSYWAQKPMVHIYGHTWPVRWGNEGEEKMIKVFSNCDEAELIVNGKSYGKKKRQSQDFPAAGLRWNIPLTKGTYQVKAIAKKGKTIIEDEMSFEYQTEKWGKPAKMLLTKSTSGDTTTVFVQLVDKNGVRCLDAKNNFRYGYTGSGRMLDNLGTSRGSRYVEAFNGRGQISVKGTNGFVSVQCEGLPNAFIEL